MLKYLQNYTKTAIFQFAFYHIFYYSAISRQRLIFFHNFFQGLLRVILQIVIYTDFWFIGFNKFLPNFCKILGQCRLKSGVWPFCRFWFLGHFCRENGRGHHVRDCGSSASNPSKMILGLYADSGLYADTENRIVGI